MKINEEPVHIINITSPCLSSPCQDTLCDGRASDPFIKVWLGHVRAGNELIY